MNSAQEISAQPDAESRRWRTLWLSDIHLGTKDCKAEFLLDFLRLNEADVIYLVGDIIDGWALKGSWHWPQSHNDVVQKLPPQSSARGPKWSTPSPATTTNS